MVILVSISELNDWHQLSLTGSKWVCVYPSYHLRMETDLVSKILFFNTIWWTNPRNKVILRIKVFGYVTLCSWCFLFFWKNAMPASSKADGSNPWRWRHYIMFLCNVRKYQSSNTVSYSTRSRSSRKLLWKPPVSHSTPRVTYHLYKPSELNLIYYFTETVALFCNRRTSYPAHANLWAVD